MISGAQQYRDKFAVRALVAHNDVAVMIEQCFLVSPQYVCMICEEVARNLKYKLVLMDKNNIQVLSGMKDACVLSALDAVDMVVSTMAGIARLQPIFSAIRVGKKILLANKETLVLSGQLFMTEVYKYNASVLPLDSEYNAIFQNLSVIYQKKLGQVSLSQYGICCIVLTDSGGVLYKITRTKLFKITPVQVYIHPNWSMGLKISVNSATVMNRVLEYIEAHHLFNVSSNEIEILLHTQTIIYATIRYSDGSVLAHFSTPDMKIFIAYAMAYLNKIKLNNISTYSKQYEIYNTYCGNNTLNLDILDTKNYPCLQTAIDASNHSQDSVIVLNADNEVTVEAFLCEMIAFIKIPNFIYRIMNTLNHFQEPSTIDDIIYIDHCIKETEIRYAIGN
ncbi:1-deoxy-D-xylulose 5-phosphate reductoisomerase [Candidatus Blochmanniella floridana]|uniref:1-deoxy-D-xylulose 5-phosphate reductoisomerase n=1 Tax=Blochmanniella floridana TaxID=203907 RepID=DXR_BLOFL|nr:RecName: Full=1-deoxy-D-xylulose 5-phosphate reductoisomerase; Short=DXP reductoisomerase; AltName: Full=1-deoxyxylulose-5-phosphate reductoisomerase; AltName: Full=2-C-methyl-D-erythritol 4-phosphate synthase [Candidatus Blochmannia floridanus]CAD83346.1 1-deoxy-D-xylulose 5-phosphate reductoisomerase [Candidatus Blochmannia floridanus]